jgi:hypothetical protein
MPRRLASTLVAFAALVLLSAPSLAAQGRVCVWSCQCSPNNVCAYWFAPALSSCPVTQCTRAGGSPSGTPCTPGDPDIPGTCPAPPPPPPPPAADETVAAAAFGSFLRGGAPPVCSAR